MPDHKCSEHAALIEKLNDIKDDTKEIRERMGKGDVSFARLYLRLRALEAIVYGACGIGLIALLKTVIEKNVGCQ